ncbi:Sh3 domain-containing protein [Neofusicoccum parvum]|nr:Sh3 domain-containing protein [Neofusicoccum parvum]
MSSQGDWQPLAIRNLRPLPTDMTSTIPAPASTQTFSWGFLRSLLAGQWWSPGFYYHPVSEGASILPSRTYYLLDACNDPYVPRSPGAHGAKLTAFFNPENPDDADGDEAANAFDNVPVFATATEWAARHNVAPTTTAGDEGGARYVYMGMYSQLRFSDKLDYDRLVEHVPYAIKMYWADQLADLARPAWVTDALMKALVPKPEYEGPLPGPAAEDDVVRQEVGAHVRDLKEWDRDARKVVGRLTKEKVFEAFSAEDAADPPGLRLWWEYLQCVGWDKGFYDMLVREQEKWDEKQRRTDEPN